MNIKTNTSKSIIPEPVFVDYCVVLIFLSLFSLRVTLNIRYYIHYQLFRNNSSAITRRLVKVKCLIKTQIENQQNCRSQIIK